MTDSVFPNSPAGLEAGLGKVLSKPSATNTRSKMCWMGYGVQFPDEGMEVSNMTDFIITFLNSDYAKGGFRYHFEKRNNCYEAQGYNKETNMFHEVYANIDLLDVKNPLHIIDEYMW